LSYIISYDYADVKRRPGGDQRPGEGCVYPAAVPTLGSQLSAAGRRRAAYLQDTGHDPGRDHTASTARGPACGQDPGPGPSHPNVPGPGKTGPGGGRTGTVPPSPLIRPGTVSTVPYNHYSLLRTIEDIYALPHLGHAAMPQARPSGTGTFS